MKYSNVVVAGGGVLGSQIAFQAAYCGFNVTIWLRSEGSIGRTQPKIDHLKQTYIDAIEKMAEDKNAWCAGLADEEGNSVGNITGTSDKLPVEEQLKMIRDLMPDAKKIGILYTTSEANSVSTIKEYKELAENYDFEIVDSGINTVADVEMAAKDLASKVDCISNLTDNTVVSSLATILDKANAANIPVFGSEIEQVKLGCLAAEGLDYVALGKQTGKMAAKVLKGEKKASEMPFETITEAGLYLNTKVAENLGITVEDDLKNSAVETYDSISEN